MERAADRRPLPDSGPTTQSTRSRTPPGPAPCRIHLRAGLV